MKKLLSCLLGFALVASAAFAGVGYSGKEIKQVAPPPCPEWYADREFNISLWGTYAFTGTNWINDRCIEADHAWGGGIDLKYFFMRYIGVGIEGWVVQAPQARQNTYVDFSDGAFLNNIQRQNNLIGSVLGTLTLRYPIPCTRFAPYIFGGGGGIFGGGQKQVNQRFIEEGEGFDLVQTTGHTGSETPAIGPGGCAMEIPLTLHIGWCRALTSHFFVAPNHN